jgi:hypothetical protein
VLVVPVGVVAVGVFVVVLAGALLVVVVGVVAGAVAGGGDVKVGPAEAGTPTGLTLVCC